MEDIFDTFTDYVADNDWAETTLVALAFLAGAVVAFYVVRTILIPTVHAAARRSTVHWDDIVLDRPVLNGISLFAPLIVISAGLSFVPHWSSDTVDVLRRVTNALFILAGVLTINAVLTAANRLYNTTPFAADRPITAYVQLAKIFIFVLGGAFMVAVLARQSPWFFISGLGAMTAVLLLIFRDTILSFVASIQLAQNDMVRVGDWIEMPSKGADGTITDIALHTVKVQNFDNTIVTIPTHALIAESFKNWRGMTESGGRRIMRAIHIDINTVRFLTDEEIERFRRFPPLARYMEQKLEELAQQPPPAVDTAPERRRLTNIGTFRAYVFRYIKNHTRIKQDELVIVRQLEPGPTGIPIQVYAFTNTTAWTEYEEIQSDIFDHLLGITPEFGLRVFQEPGGADFATLASRDGPAQPYAIPEIARD